MAFISVVHPEVSVFVPVLIVPAVFSFRSIEIILRGDSSSFNYFDPILQSTPHHSLTN